MSRLLCKEKLKQKELARDHAAENTRLKKEVARCREKLKVYEANFEANNEAQEIEVVYNEEVISTDDNTTYKNQVDYNVDDEVSVSKKVIFTLVVTV